MLKHLKNAASSMISNNTIETFDEETEKDEESGKDDNLVKKPWTPEEDETLRTLIMTHGIGFWNNIAQCLPGRSGKQCRERWHNHLSPGIVKGDWTADEDKVIVSMQKLLGNQWAKITKMLPGRTDNAVKNRFHATERHRNRKVKKQQQQQLHLSANDLAVHDKHSNSSTKSNLNDISMTSYNDGDNDGTLDGTEVEYDNESYNNETGGGSSKNNSSHGYIVNNNNKNAYACVSLPATAAVSSSILPPPAPVLTKKQQHQQLLMQQSKLLLLQQPLSPHQQLGQQHHQSLGVQVVDVYNTHDILGPETNILDEFDLHSSSSAAVPIIDRFPSPDFMLVMQQQQQQHNYHHSSLPLSIQPSPLLHSMNSNTAPLHYLAPPSLPLSATIIAPAPVTPTASVGSSSNSNTSAAAIGARDFHAHEMDYSFLAAAAASNHHHPHPYGQHHTNNTHIILSNDESQQQVQRMSNDDIIQELCRFSSPDIMSLPSLNDVDCLELIDGVDDSHHHACMWNDDNEEDGKDLNHISRDHSHYSTTTANNSNYYHHHHYNNTHNNIIDENEHDGNTGGMLDHAAIAAELVRTSTADVIMSIMESTIEDWEENEEESAFPQHLPEPITMMMQQQQQYYNPLMLHMPMPSTAAIGNNNNCMSFSIGCGVGGGNAVTNTSHHPHNSNSNNNNGGGHHNGMMNMCGINYGWNTNNAHANVNHHHNTVASSAHHHHAMSMSPQPIGYTQPQQQHINTNYYSYH